MQVRDSTAGVTPVAVEPRNTVNPEMMRKKVFMALPWMKSVHPLTAFCVANLVDRRRMTTALNFNDSFVAHSRNTCADLFLKSDAEWLFSVDDDMVFPIGSAKWFNANTGMNLPEKFAGLNTLDRLLSHGKTLIGAAYFGRHIHGRGMWAEACSNNPAEENFSRTLPVDIIKPTKWCATGLLLIHRTVFEDIAKRWPRLGPNAQGERSQFYTSSEDAALDAIDDCVKLFNSGRMDGETAMKVFTRLEAAKQEIKIGWPLGIGEDVSLCTRAAKCGHVPYVDCGLVAGHVGHMVFGPGNTRRKP